MLGPVGDKIEQWTLKGVPLINIVFNDVDWTSNDPPKSH